VGVLYYLSFAIAISSLLIFEGDSVLKHVNGQEQCNNQTGNSCARSSRLPLPLPFDDGAVEIAENEQGGDEENDNEDFKSDSEDELSLPLPFP
jgi:hypothetical protein